MIVAKSVDRNVLKAHIENDGIAILPIGACEQHGYHLPIGTDSILAENFAKRIASETDGAIFPTLEFGYSWVWSKLPGTITFSQETFKKTVFESVKSLIEMGYKKIVIINGHDSNRNAIKYTIRELSEVYHERIINLFYPGLFEYYDQVFESNTWFGMFHADEFETSLMLYFNSEFVDMTKAVKEYPEKPKLYGYDQSSLAILSKSGVYGDATIASYEKGRAIFEKILTKALLIINAM